MLTSLSFRCYSVILTVVMTGAGSLCAAESSTVVITLRPSAAAEGPDVLVRNVAMVETRNPVLKRQIEQLDLADSPSADGSTVISAKLVEFRLRLAGIESNAIVIHGKQTSVTALPLQRTAMIDRVAFPESAPSRRTEVVLARNPVPVRNSAGSQPYPLASDADGLEEAIVAAARKVILSQLPWPEENVSVRIGVPMTRELASVSNSFFPQGESPSAWKSCSFEAQLKSSGPAVGRIILDVTISSREHPSKTIPVTMDVRHFEQVVTTIRPLARGRAVTREDLCLSRRDVTGSAGYCTQVTQIVGRIPTKPLPELHIVKDDDFDAVTNSQPATRTGDFVIKRQDRVNLVAKTGGYEFTISAEALQNGRIGDVIQVRNSASKDIVSGRVISPTEVEIVK
ncbi:MAG: flagellar basal body P-ring formation chaperone FlgA [Planctomycetota bacterium]